MACFGKADILNALYDAGFHDPVARVLNAASSLQSTSPCLFCNVKSLPQVDSVGGPMCYDFSYVSFGWQQYSLGPNG
jgi:hypothetical protein